MSLGERICKLRTEKEMSQGDLADALEVSRQSISKWETNGSVPELDKLVKLSEIFGISLDELITGKEREKKTEPVAEKSVPNAANAEPQIIYVEKPVKPTLTSAQILGIILLSGSLLCFVLFACFGKKSDLSEVFALCLPVALCGALCIVTKHPLLWCCWCGSAAWWIYVLVLSAKWEQATLQILIGILLVVLSLAYTVVLHKKDRIYVPAWGWALLTIVLAGAALLLVVNLLPVSHGTVTRPTEITLSPVESLVPKG